jgi:hypothetical protein
MLHLPFLHHQNPGDLVLGRLGRLPISPVFRVTASARTAHMYVIGISGKGKSKLPEWCLFQDIAAGRGCDLIDPHSLLVDDLLRLLITRGVLANADIRQRLIYVDPACTDYVIPFNVLAMSITGRQHRGVLSRPLRPVGEGNAPDAREHAEQDRCLVLGQKANR